MKSSLLCTAFVALSQVVSAMERCVVTYKNSQIIESKERVIAEIRPEINKKSSSFGDRNGSITISKKVVVKDVPTNKWNVFEFRSAGAKALQSFKFRLDAPHIIDVTDYKCAGDAIAVYDRDDDKGRSTLIMEAYKVKNDNCATFANTPEAAWKSPNHFHRREILDAGKHHLEFIPTESPFGSGRAAFRLERIKECKVRNDNFVVLKTFFSHRLAEAACNLFGLRLAVVSSEDMIEAIEAVYDCIGENETVFIKTFIDPNNLDRNPNNSPMYLRTGDAEREGQILDNTGDVPMYRVLCQR